MSRKCETQPEPHEALIDALEAGQTGCLLARGADGADHRIYVMLGGVLAAHTEADDRLILGRLSARGGVAEQTLDELQGRLDGGGALGDALFDALPEEEVLALLFERFRENLRGFLRAPRLESFEALDAVFTDNIQVGHDSLALIAELVHAEARTAALRAQPELVLAAGAAEPEGELERQLAERCRGRTHLRELLERSPAEAGRTLEAVQDMLERGALVGVVPQPRKRDRGEASKAKPAPAGKLAPAPAAEPASVEDPAGLGVLDGPFSADDTPDGPTVAEPIRNAFFQAAVEADLAAFQDYDSSRGGGAFSTERDLLDRVDLDGSEEAPLAEHVSTETVIEMEEADAKEASRGAVSLNFSGPKLHDEEIHRKLEVVNDVLATICASIEAAEGRGSGQARLQLLVEGTAVQLAPLFKNVEVSNDGQLPTLFVLRNLRKRPEAEHRRLLNRGLTDLVERAVSAADDVLDVDALEAMLEQIAGYQQRLGV